MVCKNAVKIHKTLPGVRKTQTGGWQLCIQYSSTAHSGIIPVILGQFLHILRTSSVVPQLSAIAKSQKKHRIVTKGELGYTLIPAMHT